MITRYLRNVPYQSPWLQLLLFGAVTLVSLMLGAGAGYLLPLITDGAANMDLAMQYLSAPEAMQDQSMHPEGLVRILAMTQISAQIGLFVLPPLLYARWVYGKGFITILGLSRLPGSFTVLLIVPLIGLVLPFVAWMHEFNMGVPLTPAMELAETRAEMFVTLFLGDPSWSRFILNMIMIAIIPAVGEELFFRGIIQKYLTKGVRNVHVAVFMTAFLFSLLHFQFHGFLPRMFLGLLFGYLLVWSGNLWVPILAHLVNNGAAVVVEFLGQRGILEAGYAEFGRETGTGSVVVSLLATSLLCVVIWFHHKSSRGSSAGREAEEAL